MNAIALSKKQRWSIRKAVKRINLWHGSVRSGKTVGTIYRWIQFVGNAPPGDLLLAGKTIDALKRNIINPMLELLGGDVQYFPGRREMYLWDRVIYTVGASDERSEGKIRGSTLAGAYGDEITLWPYSFFQMMLSRMSVPGAKFFGTTNTDNPNHWLKKEYIDRKEEIGDITTFHFGIDDNPFLPPEYIAALKKEYTGLWYKRFIEGLWCIAEGAIYDYFDEDEHCLLKMPKAKWYEFSIDYGTTNPTTFGIYGVDPTGHPKIWLENEYYWDPKKEKRQKTDSEFSKDFREFIRPYNPRVGYCDPSAESFQLQLRRDGVTGIRDANNEVLDGIRTVARMEKTGEYAINYRCKATKDEKYSYCWDAKKQDLGLDVPMKQNDHCMDRDRYILHSKYGEDSYDITKFTNNR